MSRVRSSSTAAMTASLSNFDVYFDVRCRRRSSCAYRWTLLSSEEAPTLEARGVVPLTDAEWAAARIEPTQVGWRIVPDFDTLRLFYPPAPLRVSVSARVRLECLVLERGALRCRPVDGDKSNTDFAEAAVRLASILRVNETDAAGQSTAGRGVRVPIRFVL
jgi:hypothetical protein